MKKTLLLIFFSFVISFGIFLVTIQIFYHEQQNALIADEKNYYDSIQEVEKKIFLVGGSHISSLNPYFIEDYLANNGEKYDVYNLSKMANRPQRELSNIDLLISAEPTIVVYGISARDFSEIQSVNESIPKTDQPLPDPSMF